MSPERKARKGRRRPAAAPPTEDIGTQPYKLKRVDEKLVKLVTTYLDDSPAKFMREEVVPRVRDMRSRREDVLPSMAALPTMEELAVRFWSAQLDQVDERRAAQGLPPIDREPQQQEEPQSADPPLPKAADVFRAADADAGFDEPGPSLAERAAQRPQGSTETQGKRRTK